MVKKFEDLEVWKISLNLSIKLNLHLKASKDFELKNQIIRAAISIPSNIAEGFERKSNKEFIQFLHIAKGSCSELRTQLYILKEINNTNHDLLEEYIESTRKFSSMLYKLIQTRKEKFS